MKASHNLSVEQREAVIREYQEGKSGNAIATDRGVAPMVIYRVLYSAGVMRRRKPFGDTRRCRICRQEKDLSAFGRCATRPEWNYRTYECRECVAKEHRERGYSLRNNTGITAAEYERLLQEQGGTCALCPTAPSSTRRLHVDHDHRTHAIRGLLCARCNRSMHAIDDAAWMAKATRYRERRTGLTWRNSRRAGRSAMSSATTGRSERDRG